MALSPEPTYASDVREVLRFTSPTPPSYSPDHDPDLGIDAMSHISKRSRMVEISLSGSGEGPGRATAPGYSTGPLVSP